jgi:hypothetical protein
LSTSGAVDDGANGVLYCERMSYEVLIEEREPIDGWTVCTVCLNVERTETVARRKWRCSDCGVDTSNDSQRELKVYLTENPQATLEKNLATWSNVKGTRAAYKMLRSARYKCLMVLGRRLRGELPATPPAAPRSTV